MFGTFGWKIAFPLALASEALGVIWALEFFVDEQMRVGLFWATVLTAFAACAAYFLGYTLRNQDY